MTSPATAESPDPADVIRCKLHAEHSAAHDGLRDLEIQLADLRSATVGIGRDDEHDSEGATIAFEAAQLESLRDRAVERLVKIDRAMQRLDTGAYGICTGCGRPIGAPRLAALPATEFCVKCAGRRY